MNERLEIQILRAKVSSLTALVNELALAIYGDVRTSNVIQGRIEKLMSECQYAGQDYIEAFERMQEP